MIQVTYDAIMTLEQYNDGKIARDELITAADAAAAVAYASRAASAAAAIASQKTTKEQATNAQIDTLIQILGE